MVIVRRKIRLAMLYVALFLVMFGMGFLASKSTENASAKISTSQRVEFSKNNILFYEPEEEDECERRIANYSGIVQACGDTAEEMIWSALISAGFNDVQAAGIIANIYHETGKDLNPVRHGYAYFYDPQTKDETNDCWTPVDTDGDDRYECNSYNGEGDVRPNNNIIVDENGHWDLFKNITSGGPCDEPNKCQSYGIGLIGNAYGWRASLLSYIKEKQPGLLEYFYHPELYNNKSGDQLIEIIGKDNVAAIIGLQVEQMLQDEAHSKKYIQDIQAMTGSDVTPADIAGIWSEKIEGCKTCGKGQSGYVARQKDAQAVYDRYNGKRFCTVSTIGLHVPTDDWLDGAGLEGYKKDEISLGGLNGKAIDYNVVQNGQFVDYAADAGNGSGLPGFIVLHLTSADNFGAQSWTNYTSETKDDHRPIYVPPHFTIDIKARKVFQHFPLSHPSAAVASRDDEGSIFVSDLYGIQIEMVGHGGIEDKTCMIGACKEDHLYTNFTDDDWEYVAKILMAISDATGIPLTSSVKWVSDYNEAPSVMMTYDEIRSYIGVLGHEHINGKWDPLAAWDYIEPALRRLNYGYSSDRTKIEDTCVKKTNFAGIAPGDEDGGITNDGYIYYWQRGSSWKDYMLNSSCNATIGSSGCGYAALAMIATALSGKKVTPVDIADVAKQISSGAMIYCEGNVSRGSLGTMPRSVLDTNDFGLKYIYHSGGLDVTVANDIMRSGGMILFTVHSGDLANVGHWVVMRGISDDGRWKVFTSSQYYDDGVNCNPANGAGCSSFDVNNKTVDPASMINAWIIHGRGYWYEIYAK